MTRKDLGVHLVDPPLLTYTALKKPHPFPLVTYLIVQLVFK